ncbi:sigma-70 family RNA polymerase sigma factor [Myxococcota bacterium]|nr:sigma-70 family RNA polymerase sigma factor [Myxococcota bacterium]
MKAPSDEMGDIAELRAYFDRAARDEATPEERELARERAERLFAAHQDRVARLCLRMTGEPQRARELAQDTFLVAYARLPTWRGDGTFWSWLFGIARHLCLRAREKRADVLSEDGLLDPSDPAGGVMLALRAQEREAVLMAAAAAVLDPVEQEAIHLRYVENVDVDQITAILGLTDRSGARGLLQRCRRKLHRELRRLLLELGHGSSLLFGSLDP